MILNSKQAILDLMALKTETVTIDGGEVIVKEVMAEVYLDAYSHEYVVAGVDEAARGRRLSALLATRSIVDENGDRVFTDEDAPLFLSLSTKKYTAIVQAVKRLNGIDGGEKNSETTQTS